MDDTGATDAGAAYLFDGSTGAFLQAFLNPTPAINDQFGFQVAGVGGNVVVGARFDDTGAANSGAAYLFDSGTGALLQTFLNPTPAVGDQFGRTVADVGGNVLISARFDDTGATNAGAAYLFDSSTGALLLTFLNPTPATGDRFGMSVAGVGGNVLIGAIRDDTAGVDAGAAYLFDGGTGALLQTFLNPTPAIGDEFGVWVAGVGSNILIGARFDDTGAIDAGAAYLFDSSTGALLQTFLNPTPATNDQFGFSLAGVGSSVVIGARLDDTGATDAGAAYLFDSSTGALLQTYLNPTPAVGDQFGWMVAGTGGNVLVSAYRDDTGAPSAGAAYIFELVVDSDGDGVPDDEDVCPAEDSTGFDADSDGCIDRITDLGTMFDTLLADGAIDANMHNSLFAKIDAAISSTTRDNVCTAVNQLDALKNQIEAQTGKKVSQEAADLILPFITNVQNFMLAAIAPETC